MQLTPLALGGAASGIGLRIRTTWSGFASCDFRDFQAGQLVH